MPSPVFAVPWREPGRWIWDQTADAASADVVSLRTGGPRGLDEIRTALRQRHRLRTADVVFAWELRAALAVRLAVGKSHPWIAVAPVIKGPWARKMGITGRLLRSAQRVVWMSRAEKHRFEGLLSLDPARGGTDRVPWPSAAPSHQDDGTWLAAGRSGRDWMTLVDSARRSGCRGTLVGNSRTFGLARVDQRAWMPGPELDQRIAGCGFTVVCVLPVPYGCGQSMLVRGAISGKPCIATDRDFLDEYLPEEGSIRVPVQDSTALAQAISLLASDRRLRRRMAEAAHRSAVSATFGAFGARMLKIADEALRDLRQ